MGVKMFGVFCLVIFVTGVHQVMGRNIPTTLPTAYSPNNVTASSTIRSEMFFPHILETAIVTNLSISSYLDDKKIIRLNISWDEPLDENESVDAQLNIKANHTNDKCIPSSESVPISLSFQLNISDHYIIKPSMKISHPADQFLPGCGYEIELEQIQGLVQKIQKVHYVVPDCKLELINITSVERLSKSVYEVKWNKKNYDVSFLYSPKDRINAYRDILVLKKLPQSANIELNGLMDNTTYTIYGTFSNNGHETCKQSSSFDFKVSKENLYEEGPFSKIWSLKSPLLIMTAIIVVLVFIYAVLRTKLLAAIVKKIFPFLHQATTNQDTPMYDLELYKKERDSNFTISKTFREERNPHYCSNDKFELNRLNIQLKKEIGQGAFGKVYYAKAYGIGGLPGPMMVAVKQMRAEAPKEEREDFKSEIEMLKSVGDHVNIVKLLGYCTTDEPFMMVMELVPCGALKEYLINLRNKWTKQKDVRHFFPDDMEEDWLLPKSSKAYNGNITGLNYTKFAFSDSSTASYIIPESPEFLPPTPMTPKSPWRVKPPRTPASPWRIYSPHSPKPKNLILNSPIKFNNTVTSPSPSGSLNSPLIFPPGRPNSNHMTMPDSPSVTSSRLPSSTDTIATQLECDVQTPSMEDYAKPLKPELSHTELQDFALQIANGMAYLEKIPITHRDLAARNILITNDKVLKISDFGMSRTGPYTIKSAKKVPLRWMAIEAIENRQCNSKSDVWSFGVVLWEIGTLGAYPYENVVNEMILYELKMGKRLERPEICTDELYSIMLSCWSEDPEKRPSFQELAETLDVKQRKVYVDFDSINPKYVFPPTKDLKESV